MNQEILARAGIAYDEGVRRFSGNVAIYEKFVRRFPQDPTFGELKAAMESGNGEAAFRAAHTLKGTGGNLSLELFVQAVSPLVEALRSGDWPLAQQLYPPVEEQYEAVRQAIAQAE